MTPQDLHEFHQNMEQYKKVSKDEKGEFEVYDIDQFLMDAGALSKNNTHHGLEYSKGIILKNPVYDAYGNLSSYDTPTTYREVMAQLNEWYKWRGKVAYAKKKELEDLDSMVK